MTAGDSEERTAAVPQLCEQLPGSELLGCDLIIRQALRDAISYRASRPGGEGQGGLYRIAARRLFGIEV